MNKGVNSDWPGLVRVDLLEHGGRVLEILYQYLRPHFARLEVLQDLTQSEDTVVGLHRL